MEVLLFLGTALGLGALHALEPDHLASVGALSSEKRKHNHGFIWSLGHTVALLLALLITSLLAIVIPSSIFEFIVALLLIFIGVRLLLKKTLGNTKHSFGMGVMHGLAGSGAVAVLIASLGATLLQGILFVLLFGLATTLSMTSVSYVLQKIFAKTTMRLHYVLAVISVSAGVYLLTTLY